MNGSWYGSHALVVLLLVWLSVVSGMCCSISFLVMHFISFATLFLIASSSPPRPLKRIAHPSTLALEILPRQIPPPKSLHSRSLSFLDSHTLYHSDTFRLTFAAFGDVFHLHLRPNDHLIHRAARINYFKVDHNGRSVLDRTVPLVRESIRAYWGEVIATDQSPARMREDAAGVLPRPSGKPGTELGWARIIVHSQGDTARGIPPIFEGAFEVNGVTHHVQMRENYLRNKHQLDPKLVEGINDIDTQLVIWRDSDVIHPEKEDKHAHSCTHDSLDFNSSPWQNPVLRKPVRQAWYDPLGMLGPLDPRNNATHSKRDDVAGGSSSSNFQDSIGSTSGCPSTAKVVYMGVAADCEYVTNYGSPQNATLQILNNWNMASTTYKSTFNVSLGILELSIQNGTCPSAASADPPWNVGCGNVTLNDRLSLFSQWRGEKGNDGAGLWHLMSGCPTGTEVGVAWLGTLCQQSASGQTGSVVSGTAVTTNGRTEWEVVAHEVGHNFGAIVRFNFAYTDYSV